MVNNIKSGYVNPLIMMRSDRGRQAKPFYSEGTQTAEKRQKALEAEKQSIQNSLLLMKGSSGDAGSSEKNIELLEKKLEEITKEIKTSTVNSTQRKLITLVNQNVTPYHTGYARIDNAITDALKGKSQELKDNVYDIIRSDLLRHNVHGLEESDRMALISLGVEKAEYLADNFMDDKSKSSFMEAIRSIAKIGAEGKRVGTCTMEYNVKHIVEIDGDGYVHDSNSEQWLFAMEKSDPEAFETYNKLMKASGDGKIEAAFFEIHWAMKNLNKIAVYRSVYERQQDEKYNRLQKVKLDQTFSGSDTSNKDNFLASIAEKLKATQNLNVNFFLEQISRMTQTSGGYLLGRVMSLSARA